MFKCDREKMGKYTLLIRKVGIVLFASMMEGLGLGSSYMKQEFEQGVHIMGINSYPPSSESKMKMGIPPHTDHGFMTILLQNTPGLHVLDRTDGQWKSVPDAECSIVVLLADYTEVLSNGIYKSLTHRAHPSSIETRLIIGAWNLLAMDQVVEPAPELVSEKQPSKYKGSSLRDYITHIDSGDPKRFLETLRI